ncbi:EAL domain-containing protein [Spongisporangium articulatum]|uniref:EAL domain-containing protein n=1 Tax=Spongisporangium articulatum TaxID=3362603 RepID=A0ABW8ALN1_9ACTN
MSPPALKPDPVRADALPGTSRHRRRPLASTTHDDDEELLMSGCLGCSCERAAENESGGDRVLLATRVRHNQRAVRDALADLPGVSEPGPGLIEVRGHDPAWVIRTARAALTSVEADEVRALIPAPHRTDLIAQALTASSLTQLAARAEHADLLPLFEDEETAFHAVYQPIVSLTGDSPLPPAGPGPADVVGYEALLRATGPNGPIMPDQLFGAAADAGWLHVLDRVGRTSALRGAAGWLGDATLFVNFLPTTIYRPEVCLATTERAARQAGIDLGQVVFEVTESERVTDLDHLSRVFDYYRQQGCRVALDDLGAGYSSLNMLVRLRPDVVKLDKEIVGRLPDPSSRAVVAAVVEIAASYGGTVLAECIETREQALSARELGVTLGQGWYFGRPQDRRERQDDGTPHRARPTGVASPREALTRSGDDPAVRVPAPRSGSDREVRA